jgi:hypothetical protein
MADENKDNTDEHFGAKIVGHLLIRDKESKEVFVNQRDGFLNQKQLGGDDGI